MSSVERNPSFKVMSLLEARRSGIKTVKNAGGLLVHDNKVPDSSEFMRVKKMFAILADKRKAKKSYA